MSDIYKVKSGKLKLKGESDSNKKKKHKDKKRKHDHESKEESKRQKVEEASDISRHAGWWKTKDFK